MREKWKIVKVNEQNTPSSLSILENSQRENKKLHSKKGKS